MTFKLRQVLDKLTSDSKRLFLIDSIGAVGTGFILIAILLPFEEKFGMPRRALYLLFGIACVFAIYSICCHYFIDKKWRPFLRIIAVANALYCFLTAIFLVIYHDRITSLGFIYFILEIIILSCLVFIELKTASKHKEWKQIESN